jgi:hypothetical protein
MRLTVPKIDGRTLAGNLRFGVKDLETNKTIGFVQARQGMTLSETRHPNRNISLFGGKYEGSFETHDECVAFAKGVEAVLNHMVSLPEARPHQETLPATA